MRLTRRLVFTQITAMAVMALVATQAAAQPSVWQQAAAGTYSWNTAGNWTNGVPNGVGDEADFTNALSGAQTITLDTAITLGILKVNHPSGFLLTINNGSGGPLTFNQSGGATLTNSNSLTIGANIALGSAATFVNLGTLTLNGTGIATNGNTLAFTGFGTTTVSAPITGSGGLATASDFSSGLVILTANNNYTGATTFNGFVTTGIVRISGTGGRLSGTSGVTVSGAELQVGSTTAANNNGITDRIKTGVPLTLGGSSGGGRFLMAYPSSGAHSQTLGTLTITTGLSGVSTLNAVAGTLTLNLAGGPGGYTRTAGGFVDFSGGITKFNAAPTGAAIIGGLLIGATVSGTDFATLDGTNKIVAPASYASTFTSSANNTSVTGTVSATANFTINSLRTTGTTGTTVNLSGTNTLVSGGLLLTDTAGTTISGGTLRGSASGDLWIRAKGPVTISSVIADNGGATGLSVAAKLAPINTTTYTLTLTGANTYTGPTNISAGTLKIGSGGTTGALGTGAVTIGANSILEFNRSDTYTLANAVSGQGDLYVDSGTLAVTGAVTTSGIVSVQTGSTLRVQSSGSLAATAGGFAGLDIGLGSPGTATVTLQDNATMSGHTSVGIGTNADTKGILNVTGSAVVNEASAFCFVGGGAAVGVLNQTSGSSSMTWGTLTVGSISEFGAYGHLNLSAGTATIGTLLDSGLVYQGGGTLTTTGSFELSHDGATGIHYMTGGSASAPGVKLVSYAFGGSSRAEFTVAGGTFTSTAALAVNPTSTGGGTATINLKGGTLTVPAISVLGTDVTTRLNFNGGTLKANATTTSFLPASTALTATVYSGGAIFDTNGNDITIGQNLIAPSGMGVSSIAVTSGGSGYVGPPLVTISGGGGTGATAVAIVNTSGVVTSIVVTNPGTGYSSNPTVSITDTNGTGGGSGAVIGTIMRVANTSGGLTKNGAGTLTLTGTNTYTGVTTVSAGTLRFAKTAALYNGSTGSWTATNIVVNSGTTLAVNVGGTGEFTAANVDTLKALGTASGGFRTGSALGLDTTNSAGGVFTYSSTIANPNGGTNTLGLTKLGPGTLTLSGTNSYKGPTTIRSGTLLVNGNQSTATGATTVQSGGRLGGSGTVGGSVTIQTGATIAPGRSAGVLTIIGGMTMTVGSYIWELATLKDNATGTAGTDFDRIALNGGSSSLAGGSVDLNFALLAAANRPDQAPANAFWNTSHTWDIVTTAGGATTSGTPTLVTTHYAAGSFSLGRSGNNVVLSFTPVPEVPLSVGVLAGGLAVAGWVGHRRRRQKRSRYRWIW